MEEAVVGALLNVAFDRLASRQLLDYAGLLNVDAHLMKLKKALSKSRVVIGDAEAKQIKNELVRMWLEDLKDIVYDLEDVLDEFEAERLRCKLESVESPSTSNNEVWGLITSSVTSFSTTFLFDFKLISKIKEITGRLEDIAKEKNDLGLIEGTVVGSSINSGAVKPRLPTSSLVNESCVYGRDKDVEEMIQLLLADDEAACNNNSNVYCVVPVVGPGGIGKTTFVQVLYNDQEVKEHFDMRAWVCVSDEFNVVRITKAIIESTTGNPCGLKELSPLHDRLKEMFEGKKFLLVLDDVWNEDYNAWTVLSTPFRAGAKGSKVIVTTRSHKVSSIIGTVSSRHMELLSDEDCFSLFKQHAFANQNYSIDARSDLEKIGKEIVKKCKGLPLAAKSLGGLLRSKQKKDEWEKVLNNEIWDLLDDQRSELLPALKLSYYHLPSHLKPCFLYCAIFPKDYIFEKERLVLLWMAQGFVQPNENNNERMEDIGEEYFHELLWRSFFQQSSTKDKSKFVMHDLINDLAQAILGKTCFQMMGDDKQQKIQLSKRTRHLSLSKDGLKRFEAFSEATNLRTFLSYENSTSFPHSISGLKRFEAFSEATNLRTFLSYENSTSFPHSISSIQILEGLLSMTRLRVLCLKKCSIVELPESIHKLVHLRYLDLSHTNLRRLPDSVNALYHLQTLLLNHCYYLKELASDMGNLINLRHLEISGCSNFEKMPRGIGRLTELRTMTKFIVDARNGARIEELNNLKHLRGQLQILGLENVRDPILMEILSNKKHLHNLYFEWNDRIPINDSQVKSSELVLDRLQPHTNLKVLTIAGYGGTRFPIWLQSPSCYSNLVALHLSECKNCKSLPPLGQLPSLEELEISKMQGVQKVGQEFYGNGSNNKPFRSLKCLVFSRMPELEEWTGVGQEVEEFPCLEELRILHCPKLRTFSSCFPEVIEATNNTNLKSISIEGCENLESLPEGLHKLTSLESLIIKHCYGLISLPDRMHCLGCLEYLIILECPSLLCFPEGGLPSTNLRHLEIKGCKELKSLPDQMNLLTSLEELEILKCPSLLSFPGGLPSANLRSLKIYDCPELKSLPDQMNNNLTFLLELLIRNCSSLIMSFLEEGLFPSNLRLLHISNDYNSSTDLLPLFSQWEMQFYKLTSLTTLSLAGYKDVESFPEWPLPSTLTRLVIVNFPHLKSLSSKGLQHLTSLQSLDIHNCPLLKQWFDKVKREDCSILSRIRFITIDWKLIK